MAASKKKIWQKSTLTNEFYHYDENFPLLSIHVASIRPDQITQFVENIHSTCINKNAYEIIVKVDAEDPVMIKCLSDLTEKYGERHVKSLVRPRKHGPWSLWEFYNEQYRMTHEKVYFLCLFSDEVRIDTEGWDQILKKYIGFYKDNIFRLKLSDNRLRHFYKLDEVLRMPDNFPLITKKWMDICGVWGDCHSPDTFQQAVSYYLGKLNVFRDIPIFDIQLSGIDAGLLIPPEKIYNRVQNIRRLWARALTKTMRSRYRAHAEKIKFFIEASEQGAKQITFEESVGYPTELICNNNLGEKISYTCNSPAINFYGLKLLAAYFRDKRYIKRPHVFVINTFAFSVFLVAIMMFLTPHASTVFKLLSLGLMYFSMKIGKFSFLKNWAKYIYRRIKNDFKKNNIQTNSWQNSLVNNETYLHEENTPVISFHIDAKNPDKLTELVESIHSTCFNKNVYEIIIRTNTNDVRMISCLNQLSQQYGAQRIKYLQSSYNDILPLTHKNAYFLCFVSENLQMVTNGWDQILKKYIGFYSDHVFRINVSGNKLRNYYHLKDALYSPNHFTFVTKKYLDICGLWGKFHEPQVYHQLISYYLGKENIFRDIPVFDIEFSLPENHPADFSTTIEKIPFFSINKYAKNHYLLQASKIKFYIESCKQGAKEIIFDERLNYPFVMNCRNDKEMQAFYSWDMLTFDKRGLKSILKKCHDIFLYFISLASLMFIGGITGLLISESLMFDVLCIGLIFITSRKPLQDKFTHTFKKIFVER